MTERGLHYIEDDLTETWVEDWAGAGIAELEDFLAKRAHRSAHRAERIRARPQLGRERCSMRRFGLAPVALRAARRP